ncbi:MAG: STAS domain-containing protein [Saprospiraceae bacterium]|nr:STAS domain-containing protein [Saprospiraceae bacterium]
MKYSVYKQDRYTVFQLEEENMNSVVAPDLKSELLAMQIQGVNNLILDVSKVKHTDSAGLSAMLQVGSSWNTSGVFVVSANPYIRNLIDITHLDRVLFIANTVQEAVELVFKEELRRQQEDNSDETS